MQGETLSSAACHNCLDIAPESCPVCHPHPLTTNVLDELAERLRRASRTLDRLASDNEDEAEAIRLYNKSAGVALALSYVEEYRREG